MFSSDETPLESPNKTLVSNPQEANDLIVASNGISANGGSPSSLEHEEDGYEQDTKKLFLKGSKAIEDGDLVEDVDCLSRPLEKIRVANFGELSPECTSFYNKYGCALLNKAQIETNPLGDVPKNSQRNSTKDESAVNMEEGGTSVPPSQSKAQISSSNNFEIEGGKMTMKEKARRFLEEVEFVKDGMTSMRGLLVLFRAANEKIKSGGYKQDVSVLAVDKPININKHMSEILKIQQVIRKRLEDIDRSNAASGAVDWIRISLTDDLHKNFEELMMDFKVLRQQKIENYREKLKFRYFISKGEVPTEDVVDKMLRDKRDATMKGLFKTLNEMRDDILLMIKTLNPKADAKV